MARVKLPDGTITDVDLDDPRLILSGELAVVTPPTPPAPRAVSTDTPFRDIPAISKDRLCAILEDTPMGDECDAIHAALKGRPLPVAMSWMESRYGKDPNARETHNPLGLLDYSGTVPVLDVGANGVVVPLIRFRTWSEAFAEWARRMDNPTYKGGVYMPRDMPLGQFIRVYVAGPGPGYANNETAVSVTSYLDATIARLNRYLEIADAPSYDGSLGTAYTVPGLANPILLPFPLRFDIIPGDQTDQRPGYIMHPDRYIQHETGNPRPGTGALNHSQYLNDGAEGQQLSYHVTVDDALAVWKIPANEVAWHGGDGRSGVCNFKGLSCELCINHPVGSPQDKQAQQNAVILAAEVMNAAGVSILEPHGACCRRLSNPTGCHLGCPERILAQPGGFDGFAARVAAARIARRR